MERGDEVLLEFGTGFRFADGDAVYVCGSTAATGRYRDMFGPEGRESEPGRSGSSRRQL